MAGEHEVTVAADLDGFGEELSICCSCGWYVSGSLTHEADERELPWSVVERQVKAHLEEVRGVVSIVVQPSAQVDGGFAAGYASGLADGQARRPRR